MPASAFQSAYDQAADEDDDAAGPESRAHPLRPLDHRLVQVERISARVSQLGTVGMDKPPYRGVTEPERPLAGVQIPEVDIPVYGGTFGGDDGPEIAAREPW